MKSEGKAVTCQKPLNARTAFGKGENFPHKANCIDRF